MARIIPVVLPSKGRTIGVTREKDRLVGIRRGA